MRTRALSVRSAVTRGIPAWGAAVRGVALFALLACGGEPPSPATPQVGAPAAERFPPTFSGTYRVEGVTTVEATGGQREISGTVILSQEGNRYTTTFSLETAFPTKEGTIQAQVIGKGEGRVEGTTLRGTTETQIVMASVPGVDSGFAFVPRHVGPRIVSKTTGERFEDGTIVIEIESQPAEGEDYAPTRTTLRGRPIDPTSAAGGLAPVGKGAR